MKRTIACSAETLSVTKTPLTTTAQTFHIQTTKSSSKLSSGKDVKLTGSHLDSTKKPLITSALNPSQTVTPVHDDLNIVPSGYKSKMAAQSNVIKNEAEIIADFPMNQRRSSFPGISGSEKLAAAVITSGKRFQGQGKRWTSSTESADSPRELRSLHRNSLEDRRLQQAFCKLERQSCAGSLEFRQKIKEVFKDHKKIFQRSPTADEWLLLKKSRSRALQDRERWDIARRYSRRVRHFRAPPDLHDAVAKIRSYAMMEAGLFQEPEYESSGDEELVTKITSLNMSRRHTISGDLASSLPRIHQNQSKTSNYFGRRMTLADTRILHDVLELKADRMHKYYIDDVLKKRSNINETEQIPRDGSDHSKFDGGIDTNANRKEKQKSYENEEQNIAQQLHTKNVKDEELDGNTEKQTMTNETDKRDIGVDRTRETHSHGHSDKMNDRRYPIRVHNH